jgi:hypothetical protein
MKKPILISKMINAGKRWLLAVIVLLLIFESPSIAQLKSYGPDGKTDKSFRTDFLMLVPISNVREQHAPHFPMALIPTIVGAGINLYITIQSHKNASYVGTYSNAFNLTTIPSMFNLDRVLIKSDKDSNGKYEYGSDTVVAERFKFKLDTARTGISLQILSAIIKYSKACMKKDERLAISFDFHLLSVDKDGSMQDLGESTIVIPMIYVRKQPFDLSNLTAYIGKAMYAPLAKKSSPLFITVNVKEVNLNHVDPTLIEDILKSNGSDLTDVLKGALGSN